MERGAGAGAGSGEGRAEAGFDPSGAGFADRRSFPSATHACVDDLGAGPCDCDGHGAWLQRRTVRPAGMNCSFKSEGARQAVPGSK